MKLKLENFRCHKKVDFDIPNTGLVLLSGTSGAGKTTILNAITYALYGKLVKPYAHDQTKCSVAIEGYCVPGSKETLNIIRSSPGSRLKVTCNGKEYEDDAAQGVIDSLVVSHEKFLISSYVVQRLNSSILSLSPRDQVLFIKVLASVGDFNNVFRLRVQNKIRHYEAQAHHLKGEYAVVKRQLKDVMVPSRPLSENNLSPEDLRATIERLEHEINTTQTTIEQLHEQAILEKDILTLKKHLAKMEFCNDSDFEDLETEHAFLKRADVFRTEASNLKRLQKDFGHQHQKTLMAGLLSPEAQESYQKEIKILQDDYNKASAAAEAVAAAKKSIADISNEVRNKWKIKLKKGPAALQSFFKKKPQHLEKIAVQARQKIDALSRQSAVEKINRTKYACPNCDTDLIFEDGKLTRIPSPPLPKIPSSGDSNPVDYSALLSVAQKKSIQIENELTTLNVLAHRFSLVVDQVKPKVLSTSKLALFTKKINTIEKSLLTSEKSRRELDSIAASEKIFADHQKTAETILHEGDKEKLESLGEENIQKRLDLTVETLTRFRLNKEGAIALSSEIQEKQTLLAKQGRPEDAATGFTAMDKVAHLGHLQTNFQQAQKNLVGALERQTYETAVSRHNALSKEKDTLECSLKSTFDKILGFQGLSALCKKADIFATDASITEINLNAALYTKDLFAEPMQIALARVRTTLKGDRRDGMTTNVVYKGSAYSSLDQLSGGERQRCNLAFILAVNDIVGSPFLLLDECLNNLDGETHADILVFLRQICRGKLILVVAHEAALAKFDEVIVLD